MRPPLITHHQRFWPPSSGSIITSADPRQAAAASGIDSIIVLIEPLEGGQNR